MRGRRIGRSLALGAWALAFGGCPPEPEPLEPCDGLGDPLAALANRGEGRNELVAGGEVEVFDAPQGGVWSELDVVVSDMALSELVYLVVSIDDPATGESLAFARYFGNSVPLRCGEDDLLEMSRMPLGFDASFEVEDLDGRPAVLTGILQTEAGDYPITYDVILRGVPY